MRQWRLGVFLLLAAARMAAQRAETGYFQGVLAPIGQVNASGMVNVIPHVVLDNSGQITSGSIDFEVLYKFPTAVTLTSLQVRQNAATVLTVSLASLPVDFSGTAGFTRQVQFPQSSDVLNGLLANPGQYTVVLVTRDAPQGALSGTLAAAASSRVMALLAGGGGTAIGSVSAIAAIDSGGTLLSATVAFDAAFPSAAAVTAFALVDSAGYHLLDSGSRITNKQGRAHASMVPDLTNPDAYVSVLRIFDQPAAQLQVDGAGASLFGPLQTVDSQTYSVVLLPSLEAPPVNYPASAPSRMTVNTLRDANAQPVAAAFTFDVNYRLPSPALFTGLYLQDGASGVNGLAVVSAGYTVVAPFQTDPSGTGNVTSTALVNDGDSLAEIGKLLSTPDQVYVNLHTAAYPNGALRSQMAALGAPPNPAAVISAVGDLGIKSVAPGMLISIYGTDLAAAPVDLSGYRGSAASPAYQGIAVTVGGRPATFLYISPTQINTQIPYETPLGPQPVVVSAYGQTSPPVMVDVQPAAPGIFFDPVGGVVLKNADFSEVRPGNPAHTGDVLVIYCTGLGQTSPPLATGWLVPYPPVFPTATATATLGGEIAPVIYSIASPFYVGLYQVAVTVPAGLPAGDLPLQIAIQGVQSNVVKIAVAP